MEFVGTRYPIFCCTDSESSPAQFTMLATLMSFSDLQTTCLYVKLGYSHKSLVSKSTSTIVTIKNRNHSTDSLNFVQVFNELRQCTLYGLRVSVVTHCNLAPGNPCDFSSLPCLASPIFAAKNPPGAFPSVGYECSMASLNLLRSVLATQNLRPGPRFARNIKI